MPWLIDGVITCDPKERSGHDELFNEAMKYVDQREFEKAKDSFAMYCDSLRRVDHIIIRGSFAFESNTKKTENR